MPNVNTEKEFLAVLYAVHQFRPYVYGKEFVLVSDHEPLRWIDSLKDPGQRLIRWRLKLRDYEYTFKYKPGKLNTNADALSRNPKESLEEELNETCTIKPQDSDENKSNLKILSWNIAGIRAITKKNGFDYVQEEDPDIIALQEVKCDKSKLP